VISGIVAVPIMAMIMIMVRNVRIMGKFRHQIETPFDFGMDCYRFYVPCLCWPASYCKIILNKKDPELRNHIEK